MFGAIFLTISRIYMELLTTRKKSNRFGGDGMSAEDRSPEGVAKRAEASFKKEERAREGTKAMLEYEAEERAVRKNTERLRALRLAKEAADKVEEAAQPVKSVTKKRMVRSTS
jgi:hypothetical protein